MGGYKLSSRRRNNYVDEEDEGAPLLSRDSMDGQNMGYSADNGGGYDQSYDANDSNVAGSENYQLEDQAQYDSGYAQPPMPGPHQQQPVPYSVVKKWLSVNYFSSLKQ